MKKLLVVLAILVGAGVWVWNDPAEKAWIKWKFESYLASQVTDPEIKSYAEKKVREARVKVDYYRSFE